MRGGADLPVLEQSVKQIEHALPRERRPDAENVLLALASRFYTVSKLARIVGRDRMIQSSLYVEGKAEGRLEDAREFCVALARKHHPAVFDRIESIIAACDDHARLKEWAVSASDLSDAEFLSLLGA